MSNRALTVAVALQTEMPEMQVVSERFTRDANQVDCTDGPVVVISDGIAMGFTVSVYGADCDDIDGLSRDILRLTQKGFHLPDPQIPCDLLLNFQKAEPMFDEGDFRIGERMHFGTVEHSITTLAAA